MSRVFKFLALLTFVCAALHLPGQPPKMTPDEKERAEKYARIRADYAASDSYTPQVPSQGDINLIRNYIAQKKHDEALTKINALIAKNPASAELFAYQAMSLSSLGKTAGAEAATNAQKGIQDAITMTGSGASHDTAFQILNNTDIQSVADKLGLIILSRKPETKDGRSFIIVTMRKMGVRQSQNYFFNTDIIDDWQKKHPKKSGGGSVRIGEASVVSDDSGDSGPRLISTTGGGGNSKTWKSLADLQKAADGQNRDALYELGQMYLEGTSDTPRDITRAKLYLEDAARLGHRAANFRLGKMYSDGTSVPQDLARAFDYYTIAARAGDPTAQHNLGAMFASGRGVKRDYAEGLAWLILAARKNKDAVESEKKLRDFLAKYPQTIAAGEARSEKLTIELSNHPSKSDSSVPKPGPAKIDIAPLPATPMMIAPPAFAPSGSGN